MGNRGGGVNDLSTPMNFIDVSEKAAPDEIGGAGKVLLGDSQNSRPILRLT